MSTEAARELRAELDVTMQRCVPISYVEHEYGGGAGLLSIKFFAVSIFESDLNPMAFEQAIWGLPRELANYDFLAANRRLVAELATGRSAGAPVLGATAASG